jgi:hypothetical protein
MFFNIEAGDTQSCASWNAGEQVASLDLANKGSDGAYKAEIGETVAPGGERLPVMSYFYDRQINEQRQIF